MPAALIRPARVDDAVGIARVQTLGWQQGFAGLLPAHFLAARVASPDPWVDTLSSSPDRHSVFVALVDEQIVGFVAVGPVQPASDDDSLGQLFAIYLLAAHWGTGAGHALHSAGVAALADAGFTSAVLWSLRANDRSNAFYERHGWRDDGVSLDERAGDETTGEVVLALRRYRLDLRPGRSVGAQSSETGR